MEGDRLLPVSGAAAKEPLRAEFADQLRFIFGSGVVILPSQLQNRMERTRETSVLRRPWLAPAVVAQNWLARLEHFDSDLGR